MNIAEYKEENAALRKRVAELEKANSELIIHNMQLGHDLRNDEELMAIIESRLETEKSYENPDFGVKELADMIGTSQTRI